MGNIKNVFSTLSTTLKHFAEGADIENEREDYVTLIDESDPELTKVLEEAWNSVESGEIEIPDKPKKARNTRTSIDEVKVTGRNIEVKVRKPIKERNEYDEEDGRTRQ